MKKCARKKFRTGSGPNYITTPDMAVAKANLLDDQASAKAASNPLIPLVGMLGGLAQQFGGSINWAGGSAPVAKAAYGKEAVEVEGEEVLQTPDGQVSKVKGPDHDSGGVKMSIPKGTEVFAERVKDSKGKSMAERKIARERKKAKLQELIASDVSNPLKKNTYGRAMDNLMAEELADLEKQEMAGMLASLLKLPHSDNEEEAVMAYGSGMKKYNFGNNPGSSKDQFLSGNFSALQKKEPGILLTDELDLERVQRDNFKISNNTGESNDTGAQNFLSSIGEKVSSKKMDDSTIGYAPTAGDMMKLGGNLMGILGQSRITSQNRAGDTVHENMFEDVGREAIDTLEGTKDSFDVLQAKQEAELRRKTAGNKRVARRGVRGANELRAMDALYDMGLMMGELETATNTVAQKAGIDQAISQTQMSSSQAKAQGRMIARDNNDKDRDAYYTNKSKDFANITKMVQQTGKDLNDLNMNSVQMQLLSQLSQDFTVKKGKNGQLEIVEKK
jgi:hypothetical protein